MCKFDTIFFHAVTDIEIGSHLNLSIESSYKQIIRMKRVGKEVSKRTDGTLHWFIPHTHQKTFKSPREYLFRTIPIYFWLGRPWVPITSPVPCDFLDLVTRNGPYSSPTHRPTTIHHRFRPPANPQTLFTLRKSQLGLFPHFKIHIFL